MNRSIYVQQKFCWAARRTYFIQLLSSVCTGCLCRAMDPLKILCIYEAYLDDARRRYWVNPLISSRLLCGQFHTLYERLCANPEILKKYYHMPLHVFIKSDTNMRLAISPEVRLIITLKFLKYSYFNNIILLRYKDAIITLLIEAL